MLPGKHHVEMATITIKDVPDDTYRELAARAALAGQPLPAYLKAKLIEWAQRSDARDVLARVRERKRTNNSTLQAEKILAYRDRVRGDATR